MKNPIKMDDLEVPLFLETPILWHGHCSPPFAELLFTDRLLPNPQLLVDELTPDLKIEDSENRRNAIITHIVIIPWVWAAPSQ